MRALAPGKLAAASARVLARRPGETLVAEEYLPGDAHARDRPLRDD